MVRQVLTILGSKPYVRGYMLDSVYQGFRHRRNGRTVEDMGRNYLSNLVHSNHCNGDYPYMIAVLYGLDSEKFASVITPSTRQFPKYLEDGSLEVPDRFLPMEMNTYVFDVNQGYESGKNEIVRIGRPILDENVLKVFSDEIEHRKQFTSLRDYIRCSPYYKK